MRKANVKVAQKKVRALCREQRPLQLQFGGVKTRTAQKAHTTASHTRDREDPYLRLINYCPYLHPPRSSPRVENKKKKRKRNKNKSNHKRRNTRLRILLNQQPRGAAHEDSSAALLLPSERRARAPFLECAFIILICSVHCPPLLPRHISSIFRHPFPSCLSFSISFFLRS